MKQSLWKIVASFGLVASMTLLLSACGEKAATTTPTGTEAQSTTATSSARQAGGLQIEDVKEGNGAIAKKGDQISVNYKGTLANGQTFDSSYDRNQPFEFKLGSGQVIEGWEKGIVGMKEGGKRILTIPPEQAYGPNGYPPVIPPNATLKFEVELLEVQ